MFSQTHWAKHATIWCPRHLWWLIGDGTESEDDNGNAVRDTPKVDVDVSQGDTWIYPPI